MKLSKAQAAAYFARPDKQAIGLLIHGGDAMRVALRRQEVVAALIGPNGGEEMRLTRLEGAELRKDPAALIDALKAIGFFPGPRVVTVEGAHDSVAGIIIAALAAWNEGDAQIVVSAGSLRPNSKLRKAFEAHPKACAAAIYDDPPDRNEVDAALKAAGLAPIDADSHAALRLLAEQLEPGDFRQTLEKIALYKHGDTVPLTADDIAACAPLSTEAALDDALMLVADGMVTRIGPVLQKLRAQGVNATALCIGALRHFRLLYQIAADPTGRAPVWGPHRTRIPHQARLWGRERLERAIGILLETDLALRTAGATAPPMALVERSFLRLAMLAPRQAHGKADHSK